MTPLMGDFWRIGSLFLCPFGFSLGFPYFIICIYYYARIGYLRIRILSLDIPVFDTPLYILSRVGLSLFVTLSIGVLHV